MKNALPPEIESLCVLEQDGQKVPLWPYVAAVSGHRSFAQSGDIAGYPGFDREAIKNTFRNELENLARLWKDSCRGVNAPLILLSGMAEGADQLAVEVALELSSNSDYNIKVVAVLPMEEELFKLTLSEENRKHFEDLYNQAYVKYSLPLQKEPENPEYIDYCSKLADVDNSDTEPLRQEQYKKLGEFLALHSHVMFTFWDGIDVSKTSPGGTSTALHYKLEGNTEDLTQSDILTFTSVGPVVQFLIPQKESIYDKNNNPFSKRRNYIAMFYWSRHKNLWDKKNKCNFFPTYEYATEENRCKTSVSSMEEVVNTLTRIGELNWYSVNCPTEVKDLLPKSKEYLFEGHEHTEEFCDDETNILINHYTYVDQLAIWFQNRMKSNVYRFLCAVGVFLVLGSLLSSYREISQNDWGKTTFFNFVHSGQNTMYEMFSLNTWTVFKGLTLIYWGAIVGFIGVYLWAKFKNDRIRFYRFRAVAEGLRVQIFWRIAELSNCVSGHYRTHQLPVTEWLRAAINGLDVLLEAPKEENFQKPQIERMTFVRDVWINGQLMYFQKNLRGIPFEFSIMNLIWLIFKWTLRLIDRVLYYLWIPLILIFPFIPTWLTYFHARWALGAEWLQVIYGLLLIIVPVYGLIKFWENAEKPRSDLERYKQMLLPFGRAILLINAELETTNSSKKKMKNLQPVLRQLGTEAVSENASWYLSMGERELTLPQ